MDKQQQRAAGLTIGGVLASVVVTVLGRLFGWFFGLHYVLPLVVVIAASTLLRKRLPANAHAFAPALALQAGDFALTSMGVLAGMLAGDYPAAALIHVIPLELITFAACVALILRPGLPAAAALGLRHAYGLFVILSNIPVIVEIGSVDRSRLVGFVIEDVIASAVSVTVIVLLVRAARAQRRTATTLQPPPAVHPPIL